MKALNPFITCRSSDPASALRGRFLPEAAVVLSGGDYLHIVTEKSRSACYTAPFMFTIHIVIDNDIFDFAGDAPFADVRALIDEWFTGREPQDLAAVTASIHALTAKAQALHAAEQAVPPTP